jgi:hypothetical protein
LAREQCRSLKGRLGKMSAEMTPQAGEQSGAVTLSKLVMAHGWLIAQS